MIISADQETNPVYFTAEIREIEQLAAALPRAPASHGESGIGGRRDRAR